MKMQTKIDSLIENDSEAYTSDCLFKTSQKQYKIIEHPDDGIRGSSLAFPSGCRIEMVLGDLYSSPLEMYQGTITLPELGIKLQQI